MQKIGMKFIDKANIVDESRGRLNQGQVDEAIINLQDNGIIFSAMGDNVFTFTDDA